MPSGNSASSKIARRWNQRYTEMTISDFQSERDWLPLCIEYLPVAGIGLDIAMGPGGSATFLVQRGLSVIGVDISIQAVQMAKQRCPKILAVVGDTLFLPLQLPPLDLITNFYYLDRTFCKKFQNLLKPDGLLLFESLTKNILQIKPELTPENLLDTGELHDIFQDWRILAYEEKWVDTSRGTRKAIARIAARPPLV